MNDDNETPLFVADGPEAAEENKTETRPAPRWSERGAALVEFAIILPILLSLVFGIIEFGRAYEVKVQLTGAVREGARVVALGQPAGNATAAVVAAAPGSGVTVANVTVVSACAPGVDGNAV